MVTVYSHKHNYTKTISLLSIVFVKCVHLYPPCKLCKLLLTHLLCCVFKLVVTACRRLPQSLLLVVKKNNASVVSLFFFLKWNFYGSVCCLIGWICASVQSGCGESKNLKPCSPRCVFLVWTRKTPNWQISASPLQTREKENRPNKAWTCFAQSITTEWLWLFDFLCRF